MEKNNGNLNFESARYRGVLAVMAKERKLYVELNKKYLLLQSELNVLKQSYLNLQEAYIKKNYKIKKRSYAF